MAQAVASSKKLKKIYPGKTEISFREFCFVRFFDSVLCRMQRNQQNDREKAGKMCKDAELNKKTGKYTKSIDYLQKRLYYILIGVYH